MTLRVVGAGMGRTGTLSLKIALERLLGAPCYHMYEVFMHPEHIPAWHGAAQGQMPDWHALLSGYAAAVDWPPAAFWPELAKAFPDAIVLLSVRDSESWWRSASQTIFAGIGDAQGPDGWLAMLKDMMAARFTSRLDDKESAIAAFERNNAEVRRAADPKRLVEWRATDGWAPLCAALGVPVPDAPFPHVNTTEEFNARRAAGIRPGPMAKH